MRVATFALLLMTALLAGCNGAPAAPAEVLIESKPVEEVHSDEPVEAVFTPSPETRGHIAGIVVDEAIRPIEGARVHLPGLDLERFTDRDGSFGFVDLHPGPYFITVNATGYLDAEAVLQVGADEFTRAKVILKAIPPPDPYRVQQAFEGFTELTADPLFGFSFLCSACDFDFYLDRPGLDTVIVEAAFDGATTGASFYYSFATESSSIDSGSAGNPMRLEVRSEDVRDGDDHFSLRLDPASFPVPEQSKRFNVYVTAFYNEQPPAGWSFLKGDQ